MPYKLQYSHIIVLNLSLSYFHPLFSSYVQHASSHTYTHRGKLKKSPEKGRIFSNQFIIEKYTHNSTPLSPLLPHMRYSKTLGQIIVIVNIGKLWATRGKAVQFLSQSIKKQNQKIYADKKKKNRFLYR